MKSLKLSLALIVTLGLSGVALADDAAPMGSAPCSTSCNGCGHGLLSRLHLHRCNPCCEQPKVCPTPCDPCSGHKLIGLLHCIRLPKLHGHCGGCEPKCARPACRPACPKPCAPKCCKPACTTSCAPKCHSFKMPKLCLPKIRIECCAPKCKPACEPKCDPCGGHFAKLRGLFHRDRCCKQSCDPCGGHRFSLHGLFGKRCNSCDTCGMNGMNGVTAPSDTNGAPAPAPTTPAPAPKPMGAGTNSNGLLILTPAG